MISVVTEEEHKETCCIVGTNSRIIHDLSEKADRFEAAIEELERRINVVAVTDKDMAGLRNRIEALERASMSKVIVYKKHLNSVIDEVVGRGHLNYSSIVYDVLRSLGIEPKDD